MPNPTDKGANGQGIYSKRSAESNQQCRGPNYNCDGVQCPLMLDEGNVSLMGAAARDWSQAL